MKRFLYPCVIYRDEEANNYAVAFHDLGIYTEGDTVEKAYISAKLFLESYCEAVEKLGADYPVPTSYDVLVKKYPKAIVQLVFCEIGDVTANVEKVPVEDLITPEDIEGEIIPGKGFKLKTIE